MRDKPWPASTGWLIASAILAPTLWLLDATSMSLYWVARLPIKRSKGRSPEALRQSVDRSVSDRFTTAPNRRRWKVALSLAIVGALAGPFVFGAYRANPAYPVWVPLSVQQRESFATSLQGPCRQRQERLEDIVICRAVADEYERGGEYENHPDLPKYLAINSGVAAATFIGVFLLAFLILALIRGFAFLIHRYWKWLNA